MKNNKKKGYLLLLFSVIIFGVEACLIKTLVSSSDITPNVMCIMRTIFTAVISEILLLSRRLYLRKEEKKNKKENKNLISNERNDLLDYKVLNISKKKYILLICLVALIYALNIITFTHGLNITKATIGEFVNTIFSAIFVMIVFAIFFKSERKEVKSISVYLAFLVGAIGAFYASGNTFLDLANFKVDYGILLILGSGISWSLYLMLISKLIDHASRFRIMRDSQMVCILFFLLYIICTNSFGEILNLSILSLLKVLLFTIIVDIGTTLTYYKAIKIVSGIVATLFTMSCPIITYIVAYFFMGERITKVQLIGCVILFISNVILTIHSIRDEMNENKL